MKYNERNVLSIQGGETIVKDIPYPSVRILGSTVNIVNIPTVVGFMDRCIDEYRSGKHPCRQIVVTGFHGLWEAHKSPELKNILNSADMWIPDGIAPVWVARKKGFPDADRTPGADVMKAFFEKADQSGYRSFFYGDTDETLAQLKSRLEEKYPGHQVVGMYSPPFRQLSDEEDRQIVDMINDAKPDVLWVGLGMPKQDRWIYEHLDRLHMPLAIGVGAAFGFHSGKVTRVPEWIGRNGLEWVWRLACEPKKLWRRDILDGPRFIAHVLLEMTGLRKY